MYKYMLITIKITEVDFRKVLYYFKLEGWSDF